MLQEPPAQTRLRTKKVPPVEETLKLLSAQQLMRAFGVSILTVRSWTSDFGLPFVRIVGEDRDAIRYRRKRVRKWAAKNNRPFYESRI